MTDRKPHRVRGYVAGRHGKPVKVSGYLRGAGKPGGGGGVKGAVRKAASTAARKPSRKTSSTKKATPKTKAYDPKTGPSEAEIRRNAEIMHGTAAANRMLAARAKKKTSRKKK